MAPNLFPLPVHLFRPQHRLRHRIHILKHGTARVVMAPVHKPLCLGTETRAAPWQTQGSIRRGFPNCGCQTYVYSNKCFLLPTPWEMQLGQQGCFFFFLLWYNRGFGTLEHGFYHKIVKVGERRVVLQNLPIGREMHKHMSHRAWGKR